MLNFNEIYYCWFVVKLQCSVVYFDKKCNLPKLKFVLGKLKSKSYILNIETCLRLQKSTDFKTLIANQTKMSAVLLLRIEKLQNNCNDWGNDMKNHMFRKPPQNCLL